MPKKLASPTEGEISVDKTNQLLTLLKTSYTSILTTNLVGIYLHGSYVMGCFNPAVSDLDYLVVVNSPLSNKAKASIMHVTLEKLWPLSPAKGLEFHILLKQDLSTFSEPVPFDFHFSKMHYQEYLREPAKYINQMHGTDPDLTAHLMIVNQCGQVLTGEPISEVFAPVPAQAYLRSILYDIGNADTTIIDQPMYTILNLCRALAFKNERLVTSKSSGGEWALATLSPKWRPLIKLALNEYQSGSGRVSEYQAVELKAFAGYMLKRLVN